MKKFFTITIFVILITIIYFVVNIEFLSIYNWYEVPLKERSTDSITMIAISPRLTNDNNSVTHIRYEGFTVIDNPETVKEIVDYLNKLTMQIISQKEYDDDDAPKKNIVFLDSSKQEVARISASRSGYVCGMNNFKYKTYFGEIDIVRKIEELYKGD